MMGFARSLAAEAGAEGIRVNVLSPGPMPGHGIFQEIVSDFASGLGMTEDQIMPMLESSSAVQRAATVEEMGRAAIFLALEATATTGQNLIVDYGLTTWLADGLHDGIRRTRRVSRPPVGSQTSVGRGSR